MTGQSALLIGATGQTGRYLLKELLQSPHFTRVGEYGRRITEEKDLATGKEKLEQKVIDFEKLEEGAWKNAKWDVVFVTLGTTRAQAGNDEAFLKIDKDYVLNAVKAAKAEGIPQRVLYVSSGGADAKSSFIYMKSKGLTEEALAALNFSDTIVFRPGFLKGAQRAQTSFGEKAAGVVMGALSKLSPVFEIHIADLAKSMRIAGELGTAGLPAVAGATKAGGLTIIGNKGATALSKT